ncbi:uncharacterized protein LOC106643471 [Copidosoma floridanum]|uniref:uncharacterized protein LOC106643471 n=1 Tax=Copidosoma floridanum TaxID=29053 RepID=UPI000C6F6EA0|nr:uncharacterized protein LOC106643471 [Copidosoma floridanum]
MKAYECYARPCMCIKVFIRIMNKVLSHLNFSVRKLIKCNIYKCKTLCKWKMASPTEQNKNRIIWIDMEMTGLNVLEDKILELASIITDDNLNIVSDEFEIVINQSESIYESMIPWCQEQHKKTGLIDASRKSINDEQMAEEKLIIFLKRYVPHKTCPMAGNCLYMDRAFLQRYMPKVYDYLGDDVIDVASINELAKRWNKKIEKKKQRKTGDHRALGDIKDSIEELSYYKKNIFI